MPALQVSPQDHGDNALSELLSKLATAGMLGGAGITGLIREALAFQQSPERQGMRKKYGIVLSNAKKSLVRLHNPAIRSKTRPTPRPFT